MRIPLRFRCAGTGRWMAARIENISRSGVLFRTTGSLPVDTQVEMTFALPVGPGSPALLCRGRVVRAVPAAGGDTPPGIAATISAFRFLPEGNAAGRLSAPRKRAMNRESLH
jgi:hypothetical protein